MRTTLLIALLALAAFVVGARLSVPARAADARPLADEACVMRCDKAADDCMARARGDESKAKACDDQYAECLKKCR